MENEVVTRCISEKLKEKGFNWICSHYYRTKCKDLFMVFPCEDWNNTEERIYAPTISQVLRWLRDEKKIHIVIDFNGGMGWYYQIALYGLTTYEKESEHKYNSYEQAALEGIEYVLDNLI